jgi:hypothetical protein
VSSRMKHARNQAQVLDSDAIGRDGYIRVRPTWSVSQVHQMDAGGFGRYIGWLLGAMFTALLLVVYLGEDLPFWVLLVGITLGSIVGATVGHVLARFVWGRLKRSIDAVNPRQVRAREITVGSWMMTRNDGTERAIRVESAPQPTQDPEAAIRDVARPHVRFLTSTGRYVTVETDQPITVVDLAVEVAMPAAGARALP